MPPTPFERSILTLCAVGEPACRTLLSNALRAAGFRIQTDAYDSMPQREDQPRAIPNLLAVRGEPRVCLVAHSDVVRDWRGYTSRVEPTLLDLDHGGETERAIADRTRTTPLGADDRLGIAIALEAARTTTVPLAVLVTTDEEVGLCGARAVRPEWVEGFELLVQIDRGNHARQLVTKIGERLCTREWEARLLGLASEMGLPRTPCTGLSTDVAALSARGVAKNAVNLTCGYYENHSPSEYVVLREAEETLAYVRAITEAFTRPAWSEEALAAQPEGA
jgi:tripeptide aminopeptidase